MHPFYKLTAHKLRSFGQTIPWIRRRFGKSHPFGIRSGLGRTQKRAGSLSCDTHTHALAHASSTSFLPYCTHLFCKAAPRTVLGMGMGMNVTAQSQFEYMILDELRHISSFCGMFKTCEHMSNKCHSRMVCSDILHDSSMTEKRLHDVTTMTTTTTTNNNNDNNDNNVNNDIDNDNDNDDSMTMHIL